MTSVLLFAEREPSEKEYRKLLARLRQWDAEDIHVHAVMPMTASNTQAYASSDGVAGHAKALRKTDTALYHLIRTLQGQGYQADGEFTVDRPAQAVTRTVSRDHFDGVLLLTSLHPLAHVLGRDLAKRLERGTRLKAVSVN